MNQAETKETIELLYRESLDHFIEKVFPTLFKGEKNTNGDYKRVFAIVSERRKEKAGKPNRLTGSWIESILSTFGGEVGGQKRYQFSHRVTVQILD